MLCPSSTTKLGSQFRGFGHQIQISREPVDRVWICYDPYKYQTYLIFLGAVTDPLSPLPTNFQVSGFQGLLRSKFTQSCVV